MRKISYAFVTIAAFVCVLFLTNSVNAQEQINAACIGRELAKYFQYIVTNTRGLQHVRILSPAFNLTNPNEKAIFAVMKINAVEYFKPQNYPNFYGFAGNTYTVDNKRAMEFITDLNWNGDMWGSFPGTKMVFTEFGNFDTRLFNDPSYPRFGLNRTDQGQVIADMRIDYGQALADPAITGILYFNTLHASHNYTNPEYRHHNMPDGPFQAVISQDPSRAGLNSALTLGGEAFPFKIRDEANLPVGWALEIATGLDSLEPAVSFINAAHARDLNPVIRACYGADCGFAEPQVYVNFIRNIDARVNKPFWIIAGPNEPATETWAAPACTAIREPFELNDIPCNQTQFPEFHSLRPYPTSPCNRTVEQSYYICAQDLVVKEVVELTPADATSCTALDATTQRCNFTINSTANVALGIGNATFPIMGNTDNVPNAENPTMRNPIKFNQRLNEYVSWYLNGITFRAEEKPETLTADIAQNNLIIRRIIDMSGPLKKLLPRDSSSPQTSGAPEYGGNENVQTIERNNERDRIGTSRHDQIVSCGDTNNPLACYSDSTQTQRITGVTRPADNQNPGTAAFQYVPFSSTEDRIGAADTALGGGFAQCPVNAPNTTQGITCATFNALEDRRNLYFAHIEEDNELAKMLQNTYKPGGIDDANTAPTDTLQELINTPYCELLESRSNPGDRLYGELVRPGVSGETISGTLNYSANLTCDFGQPTQAQITACQQDCAARFPTNLTDRNTCNQECLRPVGQCTRELFIPFKVNVRAPGLKTTWERLVAGSMSAVKRIFPKIGANTPIDELKDIPGDSGATYQSLNQGINGGTLQSGEALAGDPNAQRPGVTAKLYFPHLGSIYDYFLKGIQNALRPKDVTVEETIAPEDAICDIQNSGIASQTLLNIIANASRWARIPVQVLITAVRVEGACRDGVGGLCALSDAEVLQYSQPGAEWPYNCPTGGTNVDGRAKGPLQFYHNSTSGWGAWEQAVNLGTGESRVPNICNIKDAVYAAAWALSASNGPNHCPQPNYDVSQTGSWDTNAMQRALLSWSIAATCQPGQQNITCATLPTAGFDPGVRDIGLTYCNYFSQYNSRIQTTCTVQ